MSDELDNLTERQRRVFAYMVKYFIKHHRLPPMQKIADRFKWSSTNAASDHVKTLERKGYLLSYRSPRPPRTPNLRFTDEAFVQYIMPRLRRRYGAWGSRNDMQKREEQFSRPGN